MWNKKKNPIKTANKDICDKELVMIIADVRPSPAAP